MRHDCMTLLVGYLRINPLPSRRELSWGFSPSLSTCPRNGTMPTGTHPTLLSAGTCATQLKLGVSRLGLFSIATAELDAQKHANGTDKSDWA